MEILYYPLTWTESSLLGNNTQFYFKVGQTNNIDSRFVFSMELPVLPPSENNDANPDQNGDNPTENKDLGEVNGEITADTDSKDLGEVNGVITADKDINGDGSESETGDIDDPDVQEGS